MDIHIINIDMKSTKTANGTKITELDDTHFLIEEEGATCEIDGKKIPIGIVAEIINFWEATNDYDNETHGIGVYLSLVSLKYHKDYMAKVLVNSGVNLKDYMKENRKYVQVLESFTYMGGVPVPIEGAIAKGEDLTKYDSKLKTFNYHTGQRTERFFKDMESAEAFIKEIVVNRVPAIFGLVGFFLDRPVNAFGNDGWQIIEQQVKNEDWMNKSAIYS